jgi:hypothetical protein
LASFSALQHTDMPRYKTLTKNADFLLCGCAQFTAKDRKIQPIKDIKFHFSVFFDRYTFWKKVSIFWLQRVKIDPIFLTIHHLLFSKEAPQTD